MTRLPDENARIWQLANAAANEMISESEMEELTRLLETDPDARAAYLEFFELHADLSINIPAAQATEQVAHDIRKSLLDDTASAPHAESRHSSEAIFDKRTSPAKLAVIASIATSLVLLATLQFSGLLQWQATPNSNGDPDTALNPRTMAARVTGLVDAKWSDVESSAQYGEPIAANRSLRLESGLAQLTFSSGAKMIVQGPAELTVVSELEAMVERAKLTVSVPDYTDGFIVRSDTANVVDMGTEFGMTIEGDGKTEIHVFEGGVVAWGNQEPGNDQYIHVTSNKSLVFDADSETPDAGAADASKFVRDIAEKLPESEDPPPLDVTNQMVLWLAADRSVRTDAKQRVIAWQDIVTRDNQVKEFAWQFDEDSRPLLVSDRFASKPAIRFDGTSDYLETSLLPTTDEQTVFVVFSLSTQTQNEPRMGQLLNYRASPRNQAEWDKENGVLQIGMLDQKQATDGAAREFGAFVRSGWKWKDDRDIVLGTVTASKQLTAGNPVICTYRYSLKEGSAKLLLNDTALASAPATSSIAMISRKVIGRRGWRNKYYCGDIAEVLIYNIALSEDEVSDVNSYLSRKYAISLGVEENE